MIKEIEIKIPTTWNDIPLKKWLELQKDIKNYEGEEDAVTALLFLHLCGLEAEYVSGLNVEDYRIIKNELASFMNNIDLPLKKIIEIDGVEYGFEPNLSQLAYGAYADITKYENITIDDNWAKIMSILYRPIIEKKSDMYSIKSYTGEQNESLFLNVGMDVHFGALFFLLTLSMDLLKGILKSTKGMEVPPNMQSILERSGEVTLHLLNSQTEMFLKSIR